MTSGRAPWRKFEVIPSILGCDFARLGRQVSAALDAGARIVHVDVMDGHFVPELTMGPLVVRALRDLVHSRGGLLDCHLMIERPETQITKFAEAGADLITIHVEATPNTHLALQQIRAAGCAAGVAVNPGTPAEAITALVELIDVCLCMTVNPGWGGQSYIDSSSEKIGALRSLLPPTVGLQVDGGIAPDTVANACDAGANLFVAGSSIFGEDDPGAAYRALDEAVTSALPAGSRAI